MSATYVYANFVFHLRMKHTAIDFHFVRDQVTIGLSHISHVHISDQLTNSLTKSLPHLHFHSHRTKIGVLYTQSILRWHDKLTPLITLSIELKTNVADLYEWPNIQLTDGSNISHNSSSRLQI